MSDELRTLTFTSRFMRSFFDKRMTKADQSRLLKALELLSENDQHPSLRVHALSGDMAGLWSASASDSLRITFERRPYGEKVLIECTKHYDR